MDPENLPPFVFLHKNHTYRLKLGFFAAPSNLKIFSKAVRNELNKLKYMYCSDLEGLIMEFGQIKSKDVIQADNRHNISVSVKVDVFIFRPPIGSVIEAVVNQVSENHVSCLVLNLFNVSIVRPEHQTFDYWEGSNVNKNEKIHVEVLSFDLTKKLPHITGKIVSNCNNKSVESEYSRSVQDISAKESSREGSVIEIIREAKCITSDDTSNSFKSAINNNSENSDLSISIYTDIEDASNNSENQSNLKEVLDLSNNSKTATHSRDILMDGDKKFTLKHNDKKNKQVGSPMFSSTPLSNSEYNINTLNLNKLKRFEQMQTHIRKHISSSNLNLNKSDVTGSTSHFNLMIDNNRSPQKAKQILNKSEAITNINLNEMKTSILKRDLIELNNSKDSDEISLCTTHSFSNASNKNNSLKLSEINSCEDKSKLMLKTSLGFKKDLTYEKVKNISPNESSDSDSIISLQNKYLTLKNKNNITSPIQSTTFSTKYGGNSNIDLVTNFFSPKLLSSTSVNQISVNKNSLKTSNSPKKLNSFNIQNNNLSKNIRDTSIKKSKNELFCSKKAKNKNEKSILNISPEETSFLNFVSQENQKLTYNKISTIENSTSASSDDEMYNSIKKSIINTKKINNYDIKVSRKRIDSTSSDISVSEDENNLLKSIYEKSFKTNEINLSSKLNISQESSKTSTAPNELKTSKAEICSTISNPNDITKNKSSMISSIQKKKHRKKITDLINELICEKSKYESSQKTENLNLEIVANTVLAKKNINNKHVNENNIVKIEKLKKNNPIEDDILDIIQNLITEKTKDDKLHNVKSNGDHTHKSNTLKTDVKKEKTKNVKIKKIKRYTVLDSLDNNNSSSENVDSTLDLIPKKYINNTQLLDKKNVKNVVYIEKNYSDSDSDALIKSFLSNNSTTKNTTSKPCKKRKRESINKEIDTHFQKKKKKYSGSSLISHDETKPNKLEESIKYPKKHHNEKIINLVKNLTNEYITPEKTKNEGLFIIKNKKKKKKKNYSVGDSICAEKCIDNSNFQQNFCERLIKESNIILKDEDFSNKIHKKKKKKIKDFDIENQNSKEKINNSNSIFIEKHIDVKVKKKKKKNLTPINSTYEDKNFDFVLNTNNKIKNITCSYLDDQIVGLANEKIEANLNKQYNDSGNNNVDYKTKKKKDKKIKKINDGSFEEDNVNHLFLKKKKKKKKREINLNNVTSEEKNLNNFLVTKKKKKKK
ncbi:uncharacterized protein PF3D7_1120600-like [Daktulosphaira vitifoliae]|uniref:uncharacterized protein PF3D7_1120600-like n=1 Tax=Daktulosphaira vitifoliae TaxID=58002 RepID=UPI0021A9B5F9|nr:uncharacterized protein PF3D7_1120600-like [Daktulosphaira vitifoliae]